MNDAIFKFKRYEDSSLSYTGIDRHSGEAVGGWDTVLKRGEYEQLFYNQRETRENSREEPPNPSRERDKPTDALPQKTAKAVSADGIVPKPQPTAKPRFETSPKKERTSVTPSEMPSRSKRAELPISTAKTFPSPMVERRRTAVSPSPSATEKKQEGIPEKGTKVLHRTFGEGTVLSLEKDLILVRFAMGEKKFIFPDAFRKGFLRYKESD